ncbi:MAG TPA: HD domain-containing phosphohydrolase [Halanaerobiales bacterium]|nr:HD domain-containing phosphohydrolase [Halanaerobiales bacterium]
MNKITVKDLSIPTEIVNRWQEIVDNLTKLLDVPTALIMRVNPPMIEVFRSSDTENNPYKVGDSEELTGLYCETVILDDDYLLVENALKDEDWKENPDIELGMISYLGYPIKWPDGDIFGTLCVLDKQENPYNQKAKDILRNFRDLIELHLSLIYKNLILQKQEKRLDITLQAIGDAVITTNPDGEIIRMNTTAERLTGWKYHEAKGQDLGKVFNIINAHTGVRVKNPVEKVLEEERVVGLANDTTLISKNGENIQIADSASPIKDQENNIVGVILVFSDVSEKYEYKQKLKRENLWLKALYKNSTEAIAILDKNHKVIDINKAFEKLFKYSLPEIKGKDMDNVMNMSKSNSANENITAKVLRGENIKKEGIRFDKNGKKIHCLIKGVPVKDDGEIIGVYGIYEDITEQKEKENEIRHLSYRDHLTDAFNRTFFESELERLNTKKEFPLGLVMIDLNGLKLINDAYGHEKGDQFLIKTAEILKDIFNEKDIIARWGGDEFIILVSNSKQNNIEKLVTEVKKQNILVTVKNNDKMPLSLAVGFSIKRKEGKKISTLFKEAEDMMYKDKLLEEKSIKSHIINTLLVTLQQKSSETKEHAERLSILAKKLGNKIKLPKSEIDRLSLLAILHDVGKTIISEKILNKPVKLTEKEWSKMKQHPATGYRICSEVDEFSHVAQEILTHHERWDGQGYPKGLKGQNIPLLSRVISIVDAFDVMTNDRPYSSAISKEEALKEINRCKGTQFDPDLVEEFIEMILEEYQEIDNIKVDKNTNVYLK